jgi:hypothetical protein
VLDSWVVGAQYDVYPRGIRPHGRTGNRLEDCMPDHQSSTRRLCSARAPASERIVKRRFSSTQFADTETPERRHRRRRSTYSRLTTLSGHSPLGNCRRARCTLSSLSKLSHSCQIQRLALTQSDCGYLQHCHRFVCIGSTLSSWLRHNRQGRPCSRM